MLGTVKTESMENTFKRRPNRDRPANSNRKTVKEVEIDIEVEQWQNLKTGEIRNVHSTVKEVYADHSFFKVFLADFARALEGFGGKKMKLLFHILDNIDPSNNSFVGTYDDIQKDTGSSRPTVASVINFLKDIDFIRQRIPGMYMVSPKYLVKGDHSKRHALMIKYNHLDYTEKQAVERKQQMEMFEV
jgi:Firmicute plasmid replication protein (RepL)